MAADARWDLLGLGTATVDDLLYVARFPEPDSKMQAQRRERRVGGLTAVALAAAARLGARCAFAGLLGPDENSRFIEAALSAVGVDCSHAVRRPDARPPHATIIVDAARATRTILFTLDGPDGADDALPPAGLIGSARVLFVDDHGVPGGVRAARIARAAGVPVVADFEREHTPGLLGDLLPLVDHLIVSARFALSVSGAAAPAEAARRLWTDQRALVVVTCGAQGGWFCAAGQAQHYAAFPVRAVDTTGCGDVFHGAYAALLPYEPDALARVRFAAAAAALKAARAGGLDSLPTRAQVQAFMAGLC